MDRYGLLESASQHISETEISNLEATAATILTSLRQAISGRDAFFPARDPVAPDTINQIYRAIERETPLAIAYQALGDLKASYRQVQPLRLEKRGNLYYLHAYCYRAETNLTFRLDRIKEIL
jgi:predicted DNA-binding transcriptional regulator YafY